MKLSILATAFVIAIAGQSAIAGGMPSTPAFAPSSEIVAHSGGCRKSSPQGQCCHAGSKPYHCH